MIDNGAFLDGLDAFNSGLLRSACPHSDNAPEHYYWHEGWLTACAVDLYRLRPWPRDIPHTVH